MIAHVLPEFVGELCAHALRQKIARFTFSEHSDGKRGFVDDGGKRAMVAIDHWRANPVRQRNDNAKALVRRDVVEVLFFDARPAAPLFEVLGTHGNERMPGGHLPGDGDAEAQAPDLKIFFTWDVFSTNDRAAWTVIVVCE